FRGRVRYLGTARPARALLLAQPDPRLPPAYQGSAPDAGPDRSRDRSAAATRGRRRRARAVAEAGERCRPAQGACPVTGAAPSSRSDGCRDTRDPARRELLLHRVLLEARVERGEIDLVERLILVEAREHVARTPR